MAPPEGTRTKEEGAETQRLALELLQKVGGGTHIMNFVYDRYGKDLHEHLPVNLCSKVLNAYKLVKDGFQILERYQFGGKGITNCFGKVNPRPEAKSLLLVSYDGQVPEASTKLRDKLLQFNSPDIYNAPPINGGAGDPYCSYAKLYEEYRKDKITKDYVRTLYSTVYQEDEEVKRYGSRFFYLPWPYLEKPKMSSEHVTMVMLQKNWNGALEAEFRANKAQAGQSSQKGSQKDKKETEESPNYPFTSPSEERVLNFVFEAIKDVIRKELKPVKTLQVEILSTINAQNTTMSKLEQELSKWNHECPPINSLVALTPSTKSVLEALNAPSSDVEFLEEVKPESAPGRAMSVEEETTTAPADPLADSDGEDMDCPCPPDSILDTEDGPPSKKRVKKGRR